MHDQDENIPINNSIYDMLYLKGCRLFKNSFKRSIFKFLTRNTTVDNSRQ